MFRHANDVIVVADREGRLLYASPSSADAALYEVKRSGKGRAQLAP